MFDNRCGWDGDDGTCRLHHFLRPRPPVQREVLRVLSGMSSWDAFVAIHARTGFADWGERWVNEIMPKVAPADLAAMEARHPCEPDDMIRSLDKVFEQCAPDYSNKICSAWYEVPDRLKAEVSENKTALRGPMLEDGVKGCFSNAGNDALPESERTDLVYSTKASGGGAIAGALTCASRLAAHFAVEAPSASDGEAAAMDSNPGGKAARDRWGIYVLGDSPAIVKAMSYEPRLYQAGHVLHEADANIVGHVETTVQPSETGDGGEDRGAVAVARNSNNGWMRAVVDLYVASLADGFVQMPGSSFMGSGAGLLSVTNRVPNALGFSGEVI